MNSFYRKIIEDKTLKNKTPEKTTDKNLRSAYFIDVNKIIEDAYQIKMRGRNKCIEREIKRGCRKTLLALNSSVFYSNFIDRYINRKVFELIPMDVGSIYMVLSEK